MTHKEFFSLPTGTRIREGRREGCVGNPGGGIVHVVWDGKEGTQPFITGGRGISRIAHMTRLAPETGSNGWVQAWHEKWMRHEI